MYSRRQLYFLGEPLGSSSTRIEEHHLILGGGGSGSTNTVQKADPWKGIQPNLMELYQGASQAYNSPVQPYPYSTIAYTPIAPPNYQQFAPQPVIQQPAVAQPMIPPGVATVQGEKVLTGSKTNENITPSSILANAKKGNETTPWTSAWNLSRTPQPGKMGPGGTLIPAGGMPVASQFTGTLAAPGMNPATLNGGINPALPVNPTIGGTSPTLGESPESTLARQQVTQQAIEGSPLQKEGEAQYLNTMQGMYLNNNPYLADMIAAAQRPLIENWQNVINPSIASQFAAGGRYGSGAQAFALGRSADALGQNLGDISARLYGQNYASERERQQAAILGAPAYAQSRYYDPMQLAGVGTNLESRQQRYINEDIARWNQAQNAQQQRLQNYSSLLQGFGGIGGTTSSSQQQGGGSPVLGALGGIGTAYGIGSSLGLGGLAGVAPAFELAGGSTGALGAGAAAGLGAIGPVGWGILGAGALLGSGIF